jgi:hypothetical protein
MNLRKLIATAAALALLPLAALAADISGTWTTSFDSQVGVQTYLHLRGEGHGSHRHLQVRQW